MPSVATRILDPWETFDAPTGSPFVLVFEDKPRSIEEHLNYLDARNIEKCVVTNASDFERTLATRAALVAGFIVDLNIPHPTRLPFSFLNETDLRPSGQSCFGLFVYSRAIKQIPSLGNQPLMILSERPATGEAAALLEDVRRPEKLVMSVRKKDLVAFQTAIGGLLDAVPGIAQDAQRSSNTAASPEASWQMLFASASHLQIADQELCGLMRSVPNFKGMLEQAHKGHFAELSELALERIRLLVRISLEAAALFPDSPTMLNFALRMPRPELEGNKLLDLIATGEVSQLGRVVAFLEQVDNQG